MKRTNINDYLCYVPALCPKTWESHFTQRSPWISSDPSRKVVPFSHAEALRDVRKENSLHCALFPTQGGAVQVETRAQSAWLQRFKVE
jgi:hypothetical protein